MEYFLKMQTGLNTYEYHTTSPINKIGDIQYTTGKLKSVAGLNLTSSINSFAEISTVSISLLDNDSHFRNLLPLDNLAVEISIQKVSGELKFVKTVITLNWSTEGVNETVLVLRCSDMSANLGGNILRVITETTFPNAVEAAYGKPIAICGEMYANYFTANVGSNGLQKMFRVDYNATPQYLIGEFLDCGSVNINMILYNGTIQLNGIAYTYATSTFVENGKTFRRVLATVPGVTVDFLTGYYTAYRKNPLQHLADILSQTSSGLVIDPTSSVNQTFLSFLKKNGWYSDGEPVQSFLHYYYSEQIKFDELLRDFIESIPGAGFRLNNNRIEFLCTPYEGLSPQKTINTSKILNFKATENPQDTVNDSVYYYHFCQATNTFYKSITLPLPEKKKSQEKKGILTKPFYFKWIAKGAISDMSLRAAKHTTIQNLYPKIKNEIEVDSDETEDLLPGALVGCTHENQIYPGARVCRIQSIRNNETSSTITMEDVTDYNKLDQSCLFLLHAYGNASSLVNAAPCKDGTIYNLNSIQVSPAAGTPHGYEFTLNGTNQRFEYSPVNAPASYSQFDILQYPIFSVSANLNPSITTGIRTIFNIFQNDSNQILCSITDGKLRFEVISNGTILFSFESAAGAVPTSSYFHFYFAKKYLTYGLYVNRAQVAFKSSNKTANVLSNLKLFGSGLLGTNFFAGAANEIRFGSNDPLGANPNISLLDYLPKSAALGFGFEGLCE